MMMTYIIIIVIMMMTTLIVNKPRNVETLVRDVNSHMRQRQEIYSIIIITIIIILSLGKSKRG